MRPVTADYANEHRMTFEHDSRRVTWLTRFGDSNAIPDPRFVDPTGLRRPSKRPWARIADRQIWQLDCYADVGLDTDTPRHELQTRALASAASWASNNKRVVRTLRHSNCRDIFVQFGSIWYDGNGPHHPS